jgi:hypothetical protein
MVDPMNLTTTNVTLDKQEGEGKIKDVRARPATEKRMNAIYPLTAAVALDFDAVELEIGSICEKKGEEAGDIHYDCTEKAL